MVESTSDNLQHIEGILANLNENEMLDHLHKEDSMEVSIRKNSLECSTQTLVLECSKQDLIDIIEAHIEEVEILHQVLYSYHCKIEKLQLATTEVCNLVCMHIA